MSELPEGWVTHRVDGLFDSFSGGTPSRATPRFWSGPIPWLSSGDIKAEEIAAGSEFITNEGLANSSAKLCRPGSVLVVVRSGILKHTLPVAIATSPVAINQDIKCFDSGNNQLNRWLALSLRASSREILRLNREGTTVQSVKYDTLKQFEIRVPPLAEQGRIVAKLQDLLSRVEACRQRLDRIPAILKRLRQAVLSAACCGRLTADWRGRNSGFDSAGNLVRTNVFQMSEATGGLEPLPDAWIWTALGNYADCSRGRFSVRPRNDPSYFGGAHPFIQIGDLPPDGGPIRSHRQTLNDRGLAVSKKFPRGTVAIAIVGATIGNTGVLTYDTCLTDSVVAVESGDELSNMYIELFLRHRRDDIRAVSYASGGQPNINLEVLNPYPLALPPLPEQHEIVRRVEALFKLADVIDGRCQKARTQLGKLAQSIMAKAFRGGELVPTEAELARREGRDYEPASALLDHICGRSPVGQEGAEARTPRKRATHPVSSKTSADYGGSSKPTERRRRRP